MDSILMREGVGGGRDGAGHGGNLAGDHAADLGVRGWWRVAAGVLSSAAAAWVLGRLPLDGRHTLFYLLLRGGLIVTLSALVGAWVSHWLLLRLERERLSMRTLSLACGVAWVLTPAAALLVERESIWSPLMMVVTAAASAASLQRLMSGAAGRDFGREREFAISSGAEPVEGPRFGLLPPADRAIWLAFGVAAGLEGALIPLAGGNTFVAGLLLAAGTFALLWRRASWMPRGSLTHQAMRLNGPAALADRSGQFNQSDQSARRESARRDEAALLRLAGAYLLAVVVAAIALQLQLSAGAGMGGAADAARKSAEAKRENAGDLAEQAQMGSGFRGIILWPVPKKKEIVAPVASDLTQFGGAKRRPLVIPFDGPYWYFQEPHDSPGRFAHVAHGDPTGVNIRSTDELPLLMQAHQKLATPVDLACCSTLTMTIANADAEAGDTEIGVVLTDSRSPGKPSVALGRRRVLSDVGISAKHPVDQELRYAIPAGAGMKRFDEITVVFRASDSRPFTGLRIGVKEFALVPR